MLNQKRKNLIIIIGSLVAIVILFVVGSVMRINKKDIDKSSIEKVVDKEGCITKEEAYRLLCCLDYTKDEMSELIALHKESIGEGSEYGYALYQIGILKYDKWEKTTDTMIISEFTDILQCYIDSKQAYSEAFEVGYEKWNTIIQDGKSEHGLYLADFLNVYDTIITELDGNKEEASTTYPKVRELLVLGEKEDLIGVHTIVTQNGAYYYNEAKNYINSYTKGKDANLSETFVKDFSSYTDQVLDCVVFDDQILYIRAVKKEEIELKNVYIKKGEGQTISTFVQGIDKEFGTIYPLNKVIENIIGDVTIKDNTVVKVNIKPDAISGKVLMTGKGYIEIENYGRLDLSEDFRIYQTYDGIAMEKVNRILVGYKSADFVISEGKICAALLKEKILAENIRVLLMTNKFASLYHDSITLSCTGDFTVTSGDSVEEYQKGEKVTFEINDKRLKKERVYIAPKKEKDKIIVNSLKRTSEAPLYRGHMEIMQEASGLLLVNELPLEEYLYAVIPSEMPTYYGKEALKVQAVCARSYAYAQLLSNSYAEYGANVDDSISCQVYNNIPENESTIEAVKATYGQVIEFEGNIINAYYYSTSAGHSNSVEDVWLGSSATEYLEGKWQISEDASVEAMATKEKTVQYDLTKEEDFMRFLKDDTMQIYDKEYPWYRWTVTLDMDAIQENIDRKLLSRYQVNSRLIQTLVSSKDDAEEVYESKDITTIGTLKSLVIGSRAESGMVKELILIGSKATVKVKSEYNIRYILAPLNATLITKDGGEQNNLELLPSAYFAMELNNKGDYISTITLYGAGYGHGVGMSQNGVKAMVESGESYEEIIEYYYKGTTVADIY